MQHHAWPAMIPATKSELVLIVALIVIAAVLAFSFVMSS
jgi:hypothetical protein